VKNHTIDSAGGWKVPASGPILAPETKVIDNCDLRSERMLKTMKQINGVPVRIGGDQHTGWLPAGAARPLPTPIRELLMDLEILYDGSGYLLCYSSRNGSVHGDTWHASVLEAEQAAIEYFGIEPRQWYSV
jgi:hypothetical protein